MRSYSSLVNRHLRDSMKAAQTNDAAVLRAGLSQELGEASAELYHLLIHLTRGPALDLVTNAGEFEGLEAWRQLT